MGREAREPDLDIEALSNIKFLCSDCSKGDPRARPAPALLSAYILFSSPYTNRPVLEALRIASIKRLLKLDKMFAELLTDGVISRLADAQRLLKEIKELQKWLGVPKAVLSLGEALQLASRVGADAEDIEELVIMLMSKPMGRPSTKRQVYVQALERKLLAGSKKPSWRQLAQQLCDCEKKAHDHQCRERLRIGVMNLERLMKRLKNESKGVKKSGRLNYTKKTPANFITSIQ